MKNEIQSFQFHTHQLTVIIDDHNEPWFIAKEVCDILEHSNTSKAVSRLDDDEKLIETIVISGQNREVLLINESGLYSLILTSRKPEAKAFKKWVTSEVLPSIRKTGGYITANANMISLSIQEYAALLKSLVSAQDRLLALPPPVKSGKWDAEETTLLAAKLAEGFGARRIAKLLNRSADSVEHKVRSFKKSVAEAV